MAGVGAADLVTGARLVGAPLLPLVARRRGAFALLAGACAASDALDGPVARRTGTAGPRGARLDSAADAVLVAALAAAAVRAEPALVRPLVAPCAGIAAVRGAAAVVGAVRWGRPVLLHTWSDKAAGAAVVAGLVGVVLTGRPGPARAAGLVAAGAAVEELWQVLAARTEPDVDAPGALGSLASALVARGRSTTASARRRAAWGTMYLDIKINCGRRRARQRSRAEREST